MVTAEAIGEIVFIWATLFFSELGFKQKEIQEARKTYL